MREMKDSRVEWIGEIPVDWEVSTIKHEYAFQTGWTPDTTHEEYFTGKNIWINISDMKSKVVFDSEKHISDEAIQLASMNISPKGSLLYAFKLSVGAVSFCGIDMYTNEAIATFLPGKNNLRFLYYMAPIFIIKNANENIYGAKLLNQKLIRNAKIVIPPLNVQERIADYLDRKCSPIDAIIARQQKVIETLKASRLSVITEAVTKGLNPDVPMKDSGIDFIGSIPETWRICRLRNIGTLQNGISKGGEFFGHGFPFVSYGDVYRNFSLPVQVTGLIDSSDEERRNYSVEAGDIFFTRTSETIEEVGFSSVCEETIPDATFAGFLIRVRPFTDDLVPKFAKYYFRSNHHRYYLVKQMNLVTRASLGQDLLKSMPVLVPPKDEQISIAAYLDKKCGAIESSIEYKQRVIERLTAYKKSLIYEVVTGKKAV